MDDEIIDIIASPELVEEISDLAIKHSIEITKFESMAGIAPVSAFPNLDPTVVEAFRQAAIIISAGTYSLGFIKAFKDLIGRNEGKVKATNRRTRKPI
jgi:hypothetical protein